MNLLLDTHIFIWWAAEPHKLPSNIQAALRNSDNVLMLSVASIWEMQIKANIGRLSLSLPVKEFVEVQCITNDIQILPVLEWHIWALADLPLLHRDPFDRLLAAQAIAEQYQLVTSDPALMKYPVPLLT